MTPAEALARIDALEKFGINLGLERMEACLDGLGNPQRRYPTVHVGGTNGKGSTALLMAGVLEAAGYRTGLYTSPPLESFGERIRVNGNCLPDDAVPALLEAVERAQSDSPGALGMTQFEIITAMAFLHFAEAKVDVAVIEVGLGGRLDSTNVIVPEVAVVTNVALEHALYLGSTPRLVAREKAGIVKAGRPLVTAAEGEALDVLEAAARDSGSPISVWGRDFVAEREGPASYLFRGRRWDWSGLSFGLLGGYQRYNLGTALAALEHLAEGGWRLPEPAVRLALARARWPGRLEVLGSGPRVVLDGAHNPHASRMLARALREDLTYTRLWIILGILGDKDARSILADLAPLADHLIVTRSAATRALDPLELEAMGRAVSGVPLRTAPSVAAALDSALQQAGAEDLVCVTGSLTTVGEARSHLRRRQWVA